LIVPPSEYPEFNEAIPGPSLNPAASIENSSDSSIVSLFDFSHELPVVEDPFFDGNPESSGNIASNV
jgi:hypothetical protein